MNDDDVVQVPVEVEHTATVPVEVVNETPEPALDPNQLIRADVEINAQEQETERARIAARTAVRIAEAQAEGDPEWRSNIEACLTRLETKLDALESRQSLTPTQSTVVITDPEAPVVETEPEPELPEESEEVTPESQEGPEPEERPKPRRRWI